MSFTWKAAKPLRTREEIARIVHEVSLARGLDELATVMALMCISVESDFWCPGNMKDVCFAANPSAFPHDSLSDDGYSSGYYQQQLSGPGVKPAWGWGGLWGDPEGTRKRMDLRASTDMFLEALPDSYWRANNAAAAGEVVADVQRPKAQYRYRYATKWDEAWALLRRALDNKPVDPPKPPAEPAGKPRFTENNVIGNWRGRPYGNSSSRNGRKPRLIVLHTSEGAGGPGLLDYMQGAGVSYHYVVDDTGENNATVWDLVDTDRASWSVLDANSYTINYCFGTSFVRHSKVEWMQKQDDAIKACAWLVAQDCKKYGIDPVVRVGNSASGYPSLKNPNTTGVTDHYGITVGLGIGNHTDVGPNFPWDVFNNYLQKYYNGIEDDDMFSDEDRRKLDYVFNELTKKFPSRSPYREPSEGTVDTGFGMLLNVDGMTHAEMVERLAVLGDKDALRRVIRAAAGEGAVKDPEFVKRAKSVLEQVPDEILEAYYQANKK